MPHNPPPQSLLRDASLFLDFDGTLVRIADRPDEIVVEERTLSLLANLGKKLQQRLTLVSGRASADVLEWLHPLELAVAGSHGLERAGGPVLAPPSLKAGLHQLQQLKAEFPEVLIEEKPMGVALHYRQEPEAKGACRAAAEHVAALTGLQVQPGRMVFELKPGSANKGTALRAIMAEAPHLGTRPIFIGDDLTDEHGFAAARELGGAGILVGEERTTAAEYRLADVDAVHDWLYEAAEALP